MNRHDGGVDLSRLTLLELVVSLREGEVSPVDAASFFLDRIDALDGLGAFVETTRERALEQASALGSVRDGAPALWGVPMADKDLVARAGVPTRYGSRAFEGFVPAASDPLAEALDRLGSVSLGKTSTPEFGMTGYTEPAAGVPARNPWDPTTGAGGSSGGAAIAVAMGMLPATTASDAGGSIRIPSATVGVVGLKPARGRLPFSNGLSSPGGLATAGPITRTVADAAYLLDALVGSAPRLHATTAPDPHLAFASGGAAREAHVPEDGSVTALLASAGPFSRALLQEPGRLRIGATLVTPWDGWTDTALDPRARAAWDWAARVLTGSGHDVADADWHPAGYPEMFTTIWRASAARLPVADEDLDELLEPFTAWMVREGRSMSAYEALGGYQAAGRFESETIDAFAPFDAVLTPALAMEPRPIGWNADGTTPLGNFARQFQYAPHTSFVNVSGLPAITIPTPAEPGERPWSVQLVGRPGGEARILQLAAQLEAARGTLPYPPSISVS
jgi:amidase